MLFEISTAAVFLDIENIFDSNLHSGHWKIWGYHDGNYEDKRLVGYDAV